MRKATVEHYLHDLEEELRDLPPTRRRELLEEIREHIGEALAEMPGDEEAGVRNVLERIGEPAAIAEEARERLSIRRARPGIRETLALILLPIGGVVIPVLGWIVGAILLVSSRVWTAREKAIGLLFVPGGLLPVVIFGLSPAQMCGSLTVDGQVVSDSCTGGTPLWAYVVAAFLLVVPFWTVFFLLTRMNRRARTV
jgi:uncharacterized membrane protein